MSDSDDEVQPAGPGRGPAYPFIPLSRAVERIDQVHSAGLSRQAFAPISLYRSWGYSKESGNARQTMAALNHYGLVEYLGRGKDRKAKLSRLAMRILLDKMPNSPERANAIREAALTPNVYKALWDRFGPDLVPDYAMETFLTMDLHFSEEAARNVIAGYTDTFSYAGLANADLAPDVQPDNKLDNKGRENDTGGQQKPPVVKVGDKIQWTSQSVDQFPNGGTVLGFSDDGQWLFTDQGNGAVPLSEVTVMDQPNTNPSLTPPPPPAHVASAMAAAAAAAAAKAREEQNQIDAKPGMRKAMFPVSGGDVTILFPEDITTEALEELGAYLDIFLKKEKRAKGIG